MRTQIPLLIISLLCCIFSSLFTFQHPEAEEWRECDTVTAKPYSTCDVCVGLVIIPQNAAKQAAAAATQTIAAAQNAAASNKNTAAHQQLVQSCKVRDVANSGVPFIFGGFGFFFAMWTALKFVLHTMFLSYLYGNVSPCLFVCRQLQITSHSLSRESVAARPNRRTWVHSWPSLLPARTSYRCSPLWSFGLPVLLVWGLLKVYVPALVLGNFSPTLQTRLKV